MTIAIDRATGKVLGQLIPTWNKPMREWPRGEAVRILTRDGYKDVPRDTVRLEEVR